MDIDNFYIHSCQVPPGRVDDLRALIEAEFAKGQTDIEKQQATLHCWLTHLRLSPEAEAVKLYIEDLIDTTDSIHWALDHLVIRTPESGTGMLEPHIDGVPMQGFEYERAFCLQLTPLTDNGQGNLILYTEGGEVILSDIEPGDVIEFYPRQTHSGSVNLTDQPRIAIYYRTLRKA